MRNVEIDDETYDLIVFAARAAGVDPAAIVARAVALLREDPASAERATAEREGRPIYVIYRGSQTTAAYDPATHRVTVTSGSLAGRVFRTPTAAASAVVAEANPGRRMGRINGRRFWRDSATGRYLDAETGDRVTRRPDGGA